MADDSKRVSELGITSTVFANDRVLVLTNPDSSPNVQTITVNNFALKIANALPIANSTTLGVIKIGPGLSVAANGVVSAPLPVASNTVTGVVKIGAGINFDANGVISVTGGGGTANTGEITFTNNVISISNTENNIYINNPNNAVQIGGQWLAQMSATSNATNLWGDGNTGGWMWVFQENNYAEQGVWVQNNAFNAQMLFNTNSNSILTITANDPSASPAISSTLSYGKIDMYGGYGITSDQPFVVQSNNYVTSVINKHNNGFAELWWINPDPQQADMPAGSDFYVESDGAWLYNSKVDSSNNYVDYGWNWDMNGVFNIPPDGDIKRNGVSVIGTGQIDGGNAFTSPTAEITVDGGGA